MSGNTIRDVAGAYATTIAGAGWGLYLLVSAAGRALSTRGRDDA